MKHWRTRVLPPLLIASLVIGIYAFHFLPTLRRSLDQSVFEKNRISVAAALPRITTALRSGDDVLLLLQIESLARAENAVAAYIIDRDGRVIIHNAVDQWGRSYTDAPHRIAASASGSLYQRTGPTHWLYSEPVVSTLTLCIPLSSQKADTQYAGIRIQATCAASILIVLSLVLLAYSFRTPDAPAATPCVRQEPATATFSPLLLERLITRSSLLALVIDAHNRIVAVHPQLIASGMFSLPPQTGAHVLDCVTDPALLRLIQRSTHTPGVEISEGWNAKTVHCVSDMHDDSRIGTMLWLEESAAKE